MAFRIPLSSRNADPSASHKPGTGGKNLKSKVPIIDRATLCSTLQLISDNFVARVAQVKVTADDISKPTVSGHVRLLLFPCVCRGRGFS